MWAPHIIVTFVIWPAMAARPLISGSGTAIGPTAFWVILERYSAIFGATLLGALGCRIHGLPVKTFADCTAVAGAVGQSIGRVGCFLVGDDYGKATDVPWGGSFPDGIQPIYDPVHPTQLYEVAWLLPVAGFLWWRRKKSPFLFGEYVALNGLGRIVIESWRINEPLLG